MNEAMTDSFCFGNKSLIIFVRFFMSVTFNERFTKAAMQIYNMFEKMKKLCDEKSHILTEISYRCFF